jgi:hypothetical protein
MAKNKAISLKPGGKNHRPLRLVWRALALTIYLYYLICEFNHCESLFLIKFLNVNKSGFELSRHSIIQRWENENMDQILIQLLEFHNILFLYLYMPDIKPPRYNCWPSLLTLSSNNHDWLRNITVIHYKRGANIVSSNPTHVRCTRYNIMW